MCFFAGKCAKQMKKLGKLEKKVGILSQMKTAAVYERKRGRPASGDRERVLKRDGYLCIHCERNGKVVAAEVVDHIIPLHIGGSDADSNKQSLCKQCHDIKSAKEAAHRKTAGG